VARILYVCQRMISCSEWMIIARRVILRSGEKVIHSSSINARAHASAIALISSTVASRIDMFFLTLFSSKERVIDQRIFQLNEVP